ncbi:MAG TPA: tetratricopeptide repeat protein [Planctomycetota bacterium]|nr:tetratricopeptide repeat protein [Planctomycetota bacterium]
MDRRRLLLYGTALPLTAGLAAAALWQPLPDCDTLATCAEFELRSGLLEEAAAKAAAVLERDPDHFLGLLVDGGCAELRGEEARAAARYERALAVAPEAQGRPRILLSLALLETGLGRKEGAAEHLREAGRDPQLRAEVAYVEGVWETRFGSPDRALERLLAAEKGAAGDARLRTGVGERLGELGRREEALAVLERAGDHPPALYAAARLKFQGGEAEKGLAVLTRLQARDRSWLRRRMERDAAFWDPFHERGDLPEGFLREGEAGRGPR